MRLVAWRRGWFGILVAALAVAWASPAPAIPIPFIANGEFGTDDALSLASWTSTGAAIPRESTHTVNTTGGDAGFNRYFTSAFAVLGASGADISSTPPGGTSTISQTFTLPGAVGSSTVTSWDLTLSFITAFDGKQSDGPDVFSAALTGQATLFSQTSNQHFGSLDAFPDCGPLASCANNQKTQSFSALYAGLLPGAYTLTFSLVESDAVWGGGPQEGTPRTNTAAGIDAVSAPGTAPLAAVSEPAPLAAVSEPTTLLLWGLTAVGLGLILRRTGRRP